jgi:hypothetical protein
LGLASRFPHDSWGQPFLLGTKETTMNKLMAWVLGATKVGKVIERIRAFLWGRKTYIAGLATALPALITIVSKFADQGGAYLLGLPTTEEFAAITKAAVK